MINPEKKKVGIIVADEQPLFRLGLSSVLKTIPIVGKITEVANDIELLERLQTTFYKVVFLDIMTAFIDSEIATRLIREKHPYVRIIIISTCEQPYIIRKLYLSGCDAYLAKKSNKEDIQLALKMVLLGKKYYSQEIFEKITLHSGSVNEKHAYKELTPTEARLLSNFCKEKSNKQIAEEVHLSIRTIENHRYNIYTKLGINNLKGLILFAIKHRLI